LKFLAKEDISKGEKANLKDQLIIVKASSQALKEEIKELKKKRKELKRAVKCSKGPGRRRGCPRQPPMRIINHTNVVDFKPVGDERPKAVHTRYYCDGCNVHPIVGPRFKCTVCHDFDFCERCEASKPHDHAFIKIDTPAKAPKVLLTVDERPEYNNTLSVHGGDPNSHLTQLFQQLSQFSQQPNGNLIEELQKPVVQEKPKVEKPVEKKVSQPVEALFQPLKVEEDDIFADLKVEEKPALTPEEVRANRILELFPDADRKALIENIRRYPYKTDDEIIDFVIFSNF